MPRTRGRALRRMAAAAATATICALVGATGAAAASAPKSFFGVVPQTPLDASTLKRMGDANVGTLRIIITWSSIDKSAAAGDEDWSTRRPGRARGRAQRDRRAPVHLRHPGLGRQGPRRPELQRLEVRALRAEVQAGAATPGRRSSAPRSTATGRAASSGRCTPRCPQDPIRAWQIWNEQNSKSFYAPKPDPKHYAKLLSAAAKAIHSRDSGADVVLGGMAELAGSHKAIEGSKYLAKLYDVKGASKSFDGVAPHPYGKSINKVTGQIDLYKDVIKKAHDKKVGLWITEIGAGSKSGGNPLNVGEKGQAKLLKKIYKYFLKQRKKLHVQQVDWYSWQDSPQSICAWCSSSGLLSTSGEREAVARTFVKFTGGKHRLSAGLSRCRRACGGPRWRRGSART